ncbi:MAG: hypothetical protein MZV70_51280 [Desulfobacterales bacterium]|nr:hypothetical protein [Desulfobacterales bacterium]
MSIVVLNSSGDPMGVADAGSIGSGIAEGAAPASEILQIHAVTTHLHQRRCERSAAAMEKIRNSTSGCLLVVATDGRLSGMITNEETCTCFFHGTGFDHE